MSMSNRSNNILKCEVDDITFPELHNKIKNSIQKDHKIRILHINIQASVPLFSSLVTGLLLMIRASLC